jgi:nucleotide-binding universal stress UspA family protein
VTPPEPPVAPPSAGSVLVGFDGSPGAEAALRWAFHEASSRGVALSVLQSWHEPLLSEHTWRERWDDPAAEEREAATRLEQVVAAHAVDHPEVLTATALVPEKPEAALVAASSEHDLVVLGSRGSGGFAALTLGSVAEHVAAAAPASVAVVPALAAEGTGITVGVDGSIGSRRSLLWAAEESRIRSSELTAVLAWTPRLPVAARGAQAFGAAATDEDARMALHRTVVEQLGPAVAATIGLSAVCGPAARALLDAAVGSELLVIGAQLVTGRHPDRLGSVARQVLRHAPCPVVIAR